MSCSGKRDAGWQGLLNSECTWIQFFFETKTGAERAELQSWLNNYADEQRKLGRLKRNAPNQLYDVMEWLEYRKVVGNDSTPVGLAGVRLPGRCAWSTRSACCWRSSRCALPKWASAAHWARRAARSSSSS